MWPGQTAAGGERDPQDPQANPYRQPNPHEQPTQTNPYLEPQQAPPWIAPTTPAAAPQPPRGGGKRTTVIAVAVAAAVVIAAGVTGFLVLGGDKDDAASPEPTESAPSKASEPTPTGGDDGRGGAEPKPVVPGWKVVVNPKRGIAFDVPAKWQRKDADWASYVSDNKDPEDTPLVGFLAPAVLEEQWCTSDEDKNGTTENTPIAAAGSRGENGAKSTEEAARHNVSQWIYGGYTQPDRSKVKPGTVESFTTASGITGSVATATSSGVGKKGKCGTDGKATAFAFKDSKGDFVSWTFHGVKGVKEEVPDATVRKILSTVRLTGGSSRQ
ncbi:hypothetical protein [Streptomyces netropsis]|uniref:DUF8017 domain-containing protein n=1 Tax=Streptomyces netropsis TaxID=55404 RepID=A0A7W7LFG4_STRNE|nr:hypothetical protein [Streptomyces netropsis]MBB4889245.1 hypothetical protein [Streptomyces netropsis]GGR46994.1 hypothetical protein GCM10010219_60620 [Streptomyces netropsis]